MSAITALTALLRAGLPSDVSIYHTSVTDARPPDRYIILTGGTGALRAETFTGQHLSRTYEVRATIVALLPQDAAGTPGPRAEWLANKVDGLLIGARPSMDGLHCSRITGDGPIYMASDEAILDRQSAYYVADYSYSVTQA